MAAIALGSNLPSNAGGPRQTLQSAVQALGRLGRVAAVSSLRRTEPVGYHEQPVFLNGAALLETELPPVELLRALLAIEQEHGRDRSRGIEKGPRTLDLDLLLYDDCVVETAELLLPHPEMHRRRFVLEPLAEIAPEWIHPVFGATVAVLLGELG